MDELFIEGPVDRRLLCMAIDEGDTCIETFLFHLSMESQSTMHGFEHKPAVCVKVQGTDTELEERLVNLRSRGKSMQIVAFDLHTEQGPRATRGFADSLARLARG